MEEKIRNSKTLTEQENSLCKRMLEARRIPSLMTFQVLIQQGKMNAALDVLDLRQLQRTGRRIQEQEQSEINNQDSIWNGTLIPTRESCLLDLDFPKEKESKSHKEPPNAKTAPNCA